MTTTSTNELAAAQQRVTNAKAELAQLRSERIEVEGRAAKAKSDKLASKADPREFKKACTRLSDATDELERLSLLIGDAEVELRAAEDADARAALAIEAVRVEAEIAKLAQTAEDFCASVGRHLAITSQLSAALERGEHELKQLSARALAVGAQLPGFGARLASAREAHDAFGSRSRALANGMVGVRSPQQSERIASALREGLGLRAPREGARCPADQQVASMLSGTYFELLERSEASN